MDGTHSFCACLSLRIQSLVNEQYFCAFEKRLKNVQLYPCIVLTDVA